MDPFTLISAIGFPAVLAIGGIAAWRITRNRDTAANPEATQAQWRDDSLDEWRRQREAEAEAARQQRAREAAKRPPSDEETRTTEQTRTRMGG
ncbi:MAG: hypothetical protein U5Q44_10535 [Dehalococcoidia bacterium]|nr:hypothetical protein [Dehalococcoidia bacterium]